MRPLQFSASAVLLVLLTAGCKGEKGEPTGTATGTATGTGPRVASQLTCQQPNGQFARCALSLERAGGFEITLSSITTCAAHGNAIRLTRPVEERLTGDACYETPGRTWRYGGPYPVGTAVALEIVAPPLELPAQLRVSGSFPDWRLDFEDGGDQDFDDLQLRVRALPSP